MSSKQRTILVVDDDPGEIALLTAQLERRGSYRTISTTSSRRALDLAQEEAPDLVITDLVMAEMDGLALTRALRDDFPSLPILLMTGKSGMEMAEAALEAGATDFALKPVDPTDLFARIEHALRQTPGREILREATRRTFDAHSILGEHPRIQSLRGAIANVAAVPGVPALLLGESGTGKNLVARAIHTASAGAAYRFVEVNCAALPTHLLEAELFGYEKGAFTDARTTKKGLAEVADGGTLFLDEIGNLPLELQAKLLTFLESRSFRRVGGTRDLDVELRVIAATNADLEATVRNGKFREDLFYRLNVAQFMLPPLREVRSDIPLLARHFIARAAEYFRKTVPEIDEAGLRLLQQHDWPGNARELRNIIERALIFSTGGKLVVDQPLALRGAAGTVSSPVEGSVAGVVSLPMGLTLEEVERRYIAAALAAAGGQVAKAADELGITRKVLWMRRKKLGLLDAPE